MSHHAEREVTVKVPEGLHARPAAKLVALARTFSADLELVHAGRTANPRSAAKLMLLAVKEHDRVRIRAEGIDAAQAVDALCTLLDDASEAAPPPTTPPAPHTQAPHTHAGPAPTVTPSLRGIGGSAGFALGPAFPYYRAAVAIDRAAIPQPERADQRARFHAARASIGAGVGHGSDTANDIHAALIEIIQDPDWIAEIEAAIAAGTSAVAATIDAGEALAVTFEAVDDSYVRARADDIRGAARAVALRLTGQRDPALAEVPPGAIVIAEDLNAWDIAGADLSRFGGIVCATGAPVAHVAIMARAFGIPAVFGCAHLHPVPPGTEIGLDGATGEVVIAPTGPARARLVTARAAWRAALNDLAIWATVEPRTRAGIAVKIAANLGSIKEIDAATRAGAMGVGLFRSELMFIEQRRLLTEQEQFTHYDQVARAFPDHPVVIRTLDIGGDKSLPGLDLPPEDNPFLGCRGIRLCLDRPDLFKPQLRALLRAALAGNVEIMLSMVSDITEIHRTRALIDQCRAELTAEAIPHATARLGIMIETPASVLLADHFAREVDFFSLGTNDLTQYVMAADRLNPSVAQFNRPDHPAVLHAIALTAAAAGAANIPVSVCGEAAANPAMIAKFLERGVTSLSMSPASILGTKKFIAEEAG